MKFAIGSVLVFGGLVAMAGSAGDCDGACMDQANSLSTMLTIIAGGLVSIALGGLMIASAQND